MENSYVCCFWCKKNKIDEQHWCVLTMRYLKVNCVALHYRDRTRESVKEKENHVINGSIMAF